MISCIFDVNTYYHMYRSMLFGEARIKTLGRGLHHSTLFPLPELRYCSLETAISGWSIMTLDLPCAILAASIVISQMRKLLWHSYWAWECLTRDMILAIYIYVSVLYQVFLVAWIFSLSLQIFWQQITVFFHKVFRPSSLPLISYFRGNLL